MCTEVIQIRTLPPTLYHRTHCARKNHTLVQRMIVISKNIPLIRTRQSVCVFYAKEVTFSRHCVQYQPLMRPEAHKLPLWNHTPVKALKFPGHYTIEHSKQHVCMYCTYVHEELWLREQWDIHYNDYHGNVENDFKSLQTNENQNIDHRTRA